MGDPALPDDELDAFVESIVARLASFDRASATITVATTAGSSPLLVFSASTSS